jgi:hypothetical protein
MVGGSGAEASSTVASRLKKLDIAHSHVPLTCHVSLSHEAAVSGRLPCRPTRGSWRRRVPHPLTSSVEPALGRGLRCLVGGLCCLASLEEAGGPCSK